MYRLAFFVPAWAFFTLATQTQTCAMWQCPRRIDCCLPSMLQAFAFQSPQAHRSQPYRPWNLLNSHTSAAVYWISRPRPCLSAFLQPLSLTALPLVALSTTSSHSSDTIVNSKMNGSQVRILYRMLSCKRCNVCALSDARKLAQRHGSCSTHASHSPHHSSR